MNTGEITDAQKRMPDVQPESFRDRLATIDAKGKRKWVFAQKPKGKFYSWRSWVSFGFFLLFFVIPFLRIDGRPMIMFNIPAAKFIIFGKIFWPQDFFIFGVAMITFIVFIVLFTAAFGRLFCGWVCPQTIFMEMFFRRIEYLIEGDAARQRQRDKEPWTARKIRIKLTKHFVFFVMTFVIANFFLAYIIGTDELWKIITEPVQEHKGGFIAVVVFSFVFYGVYAYFREQVCTVVCPYGRLQSVLLDSNSLLVAYDYKRGEPRGKFSKKHSPEINTGDCIDCFQCVKVCPTGIDIRHGTQMECVGCTACIDACNNIMAGLNRAPNLIRYASENGIAKNQKLKFTGRMKFYSLVLVALTALLTVLLVTRKNVDGTIVRAPGSLFLEKAQDSISNLYILKVVNKTSEDIQLDLRIEDVPGRIIEAEGRPILVKKEEQGKGSFFIVLPKSVLHDRKTSLKIGLYEGERKITEMKTSFIGPFSNYSK